MKPDFTLVTGNLNKLTEFSRLLPDSISYDHQALDLEEIQSLDSVEIISRKVRVAYSILKKPVVVEDVSIMLDSLNGLPGPFIKFFEQRLGKDAVYQLVGADSPATVNCNIALYDGTALTLAHGEVRGRTSAPRGENGFGFDYCFVPEGSDKTYAEMPPAEKDAVSHRSRAVADLIKKLS